MKVNQDMPAFVGTLLVNQGKVLLQLRDDKPNIWNPGMWAIPGGKVEEGENVLEAAKRELEEETGYILKNPEQFHVEILHTQVEGYESFGRTFFFEEYDGVQPIGCFEGQKMDWLSEEEILTVPFVIDQLPVIKAFYKKYASSKLDEA